MKFSLISLRFPFIIRLAYALESSKSAVERGNTRVTEVKWKRVRLVIDDKPKSRLAFEVDNGTSLRASLKGLVS